MVPIKDNLRYRSVAWVSVAIFAVNVFVYIYEIALGVSAKLQSTTSTWMTVHDSFVGGLTSGSLGAMLHSAGTVLSSIFMHQSFMHIFGNMCFFFTFAPALEARMGHIRFLFFYLVSGLVAAVAFMFTDPSGLGHGLGASGAIGGVMGAYLIYFPRARVHGWSPLLTPLTSIGVFFLADFFLMQWFSIWQEAHMPPGQAAGVAYWAHIGGIAFGMAIAALMALSDAGRLKMKDVCFYLIAVELVIAAVAATMIRGTPMAVAFAAAVVFACFVYAARYKHGSAPWYKSLGTPLTTVLIAVMVVVSLEQLTEICLSHSADWQTVHVGVISALAMIGSIIVATSARKLPVVKKPIVIVPRPKHDERILGEVVADLVVGFFRLIARAVTAPVTAAGVIMRQGSQALTRMGLTSSSNKGGSL